MANASEPMNKPQKTNDKQTPAAPTSASKSSPVKEKKEGKKILLDF